MSREKTDMRIAADAAGLKYSTVYARVCSGMSLEQAVSTPPNESVYTKDIRKFIHEHCSGEWTRDLVDLVNDKFGTSFTENQIRAYKKNHKLSSGLNGQYHKGHIPANKGKKLDDFMSKDTQEKFRKNSFSKGDIPHNQLPIGTEILRPDGYVWIKISNPNQWKQKHRILYESYHSAGIPTGKLVTFIDGNRQNFAKENLALISKEENKYLNKMGLRFKDKDMTTTGIALARLKSTISKIERR